MIAERVYRALIGLYPDAFRREYGELMVQVFRDVSREAYRLGGSAALIGWWAETLIDVVHTVIEQRRAVVMTRSTVISTRWAAIISVMLCLPLFVTYSVSVYKLEPLASLLTVDGSGAQPTMAGRILMLVGLLGLPVAFVISLLSMVGRRDTEATRIFNITRTHAMIGSTILGMVLIPQASMVLYELRPFVAALGTYAIFGQVLFLGGLLVLPMMYLLNGAPRIVRIASGGTVKLRPTSINLIIGATILLVILMFASALLLESLACASGVPNCD